MSRPSRARRCRAALLPLAVSLALAPIAPAFAQAISAPGLIAPGKISYDARGMPTIQAGNDDDAAFLQGYAHAQYRFFQMDLTRRQVSGTLAALVGASQLANDVQARTLGLRRAAEKSWDAMSDDMRGWLAAYAAGVNHWLATNPLPPEYQALGLTRAEPWTPVDSLAVGKGLAFQLSFDLDIDATIQLGAYQQAGAAAGFDGTKLFFGDLHRSAPIDDRVTVPGFQPGGAKAAPATAAAAPAALPHVDPDTVALARAYRDRVRDNPLLAKALAGRDTPVGSNEWVIGGALTASGKPILSNDPHLSLALPPVFTEQHVLSTDARYAAPMDVTGVTVPGAPGVIQGCNQRVCWGTTTNSLDVTDVFQETLVLNGYGLPVAIVHDGVEEPVQWLFQSYYVNQLDGTPDHVVRDNSIGYANGAVTVIVPRRNDGPLVQIDAASGKGLSVAYTGWGATKEIESFRRINRAGNLDEFREALTYFDFGSQNFAYADVDGNIAYFTSAEAPVRTDLQTEGAPGGGVPPWLIRDGSGALKHDWMPVQHPQPNQATPFEILPADEMPHVVNPEQGYFANANNDPIGFSLDNDPLNQQRPGGGVYYLDWGGASSLRMGRIDREIQAHVAAGHKITAEDMQALQANTKALDAELVLPYLIAAYDDARQPGAWAPLAELAGRDRIGQAIERLAAWDYSTPTGIAQGFDPGDDPSALPEPSQAEADASVAATLWAMWRSQALRDTIDATLDGVGLGDYRPSASLAFTGFKFMLDQFGALGGRGASGLSFFAPADLPSGAPDAAAARDYVLLASLAKALDRLASADFAPAFGGSTDLADYRWGRLHRIVFEHPLGGPFSIPGQGAPSPYGFADLGEGLPGIARGGAWETVNVASYDLRADGVNDFMFGSGSARRFVGEMSPTIAASEVIPGGNAAVIGSPFYADQLPLWLTNRYHALPISAAAALAQSGSTLTFTP
jgi:penicillin amidase